MPIYEVGGKKYEFDEELTPDELEELRVKVGGAPKTQPRPDVTVTRIGDREIAQPEETTAQEPAGVAEYLLNAFKRGVINAPAALDALLRAGYGKMAAAEMAKTGAIPQEEVMRRVYGIGEESKPIIQAASEAFTESQKRIAPVYEKVGFKPPKTDMRAPGPISEVVGAGVEAVADPTSYIGGVGLLKTPVRAASEFLTGAFGEIGGKAGESIERAVTGEESTGVGRLAGSILGGVGTAAPREVATDALTRSLDQITKNRNLLKGKPEVTETYARGAAKSLLELAAKEQGAESVDALIQLVNDASRFVNKSDAPLVIAMADNPVIRQQVERLAKINPSFREKVNRVVQQASSDIQAKSEKMFGKPYSAEVKPEAGLKVAPAVQRQRKDIEDELSNLTEGVTPVMDPETLGTRIEALIEQRKKAARREVSPDYEKLLADARAADVRMPAEGVEQIYQFVRQNNLRDIFGKGTKVDSDIMKFLSPKEFPVPGTAETVLEHIPISFDNVESLKKAINGLKRQRMSEDSMRKVLQLEEVVDAARETIPGDFSKRLNDIDLKYVEKIGIPFGAQGIKDVDSKKYATQVAPVIVKNAESYRQFIKAVGKESGDQIAENAIISEVYDKAVKDGMLNAGKLSKYLKDKKEIISQIPGLEDKLRKAVLDDRELRSRLGSLDKAAKAAEARVANNALTQFDAPDYGTLASKVINSPRDRQKIMRDIKDLDADTAKAVRNALRLEVINLGRRNANGFMQYVMDPANKAGIEAVFGEAFQPSLRKLALFSDKVSAADISKLGVAIDRRELDALAQIVPGIDIPYLSSTLRDRITSLPQKVVRLLSKYNSSQLATATDEAIMELMLDPNGVQKLANTVTTIKFDLSNPASLGKMADSLSRVLPRSFYTSGKTALGGEERARVEREARRAEAADFIPGGFEEVEQPPEFAHGGVIKKAGGGYTLQEEMLLKKYDRGGSVSRPTLPADRYAGYKEDGDEEGKLKRFFEAAIRELPAAIKQNVTSNADLAAKYLKFKFGAMSPDEAVMVAKALPEGLKQTAAAVIQTAKEAPRAMAEATPESAGRFAGQMLAGEMTDPTRLARAVGSVTKPVMSQVVKPKGGDFPKSLEAIGALKTWEPDTDLPVPEKAINNWLDTKLSKYIRNEMATPEDPIRKLAEEGILHVDPEQINYDLAAYGRPNMYGTTAAQHLAKSDLAKIWEGAADNQMGYDTAEMVVKYGQASRSSLDMLSYKRLLAGNPWIADVAAKDPNRPIYVPADTLGRDLGFDHLRDELFNAVDPESSFPQQLRLTEAQLGRMSVPDAVRHVSKINKWREKQKAEANFALANNAATVPFKDYPDQKYGWFQLRAKSADDVSAREADEIGEDVVVKESQKALQDALKYEGDLMGHCVGGYCNDVISGRSQIYSLRDKKTGSPHVTIEVKPRMTPSEFYHSEIVPQSLLDKLSKAEQSGMPFDWEELVRNSPEYESIPKDIVQIKGKANLKPKDEYIPFVQDFVRSKDWGEIKDLQNTDLFEISPDSDVANFLKSSNRPVPKYVTNDELSEILKSLGKKDTFRNKLKSTRLGQFD